MTKEKFNELKKYRIEESYLKTVNYLFTVLLIVFSIIILLISLRFFWEVCHNNTFEIICYGIILIILSIISIFIDIKREYYEECLDIVQNNIDLLKGKNKKEEK